MERIGSVADQAILSVVLTRVRQGPASMSCVLIYSVGMNTTGFKWRIAKGCLMTSEADKGVDSIFLCLERLARDQVDPW
jgi:hypothetical protein